MKNFIIGLLCGICILLLAGAYSAEKSDFGIVVPKDGFAIVRDVSGELYIVKDKLGSKTERVFLTGQKF